MLGKGRGFFVFLGSLLYLTEVSPLKQHFLGVAVPSSMSDIIESLHATRDCSLSLLFCEEGALFISLTVQLTAPIYIETLIGKLLLQVIVPCTSTLQPTVSVYAMQLVIVPTASQITLVLSARLYLILSLIIFNVSAPIGEILDPWQHLVVLVQEVLPLIEQLSNVFLG